MKVMTKKERLKRIFRKIFSNIYLRIALVGALFVGVPLIIYFRLVQSSPIPPVVTGPIIGKVTTTTARVLLEFSSEALVTVILTDPDGNQVKAVRNTKAFIPVPFAFEGLEPSTTYTVSLDNPSFSIVDSYFTTLSGESGKLNFGVVSCNDRSWQASQSPEEDLWADMLIKIKNKEIQYLLHLGDQIYMDGGGYPSPYDFIIELLNDTPQDQWESLRPLILETIRNEYRLTWNLPTVKESLAKIPSLMIFDDHEVRNDWGYRSSDSNTQSSDYFYGILARQVYYEYERQLREDINFDDLSIYTKEYFYEVLNDIGFFFMEYRAIRTWNKGSSQMGEEPQIGQTQAGMLQQILDPDGAESANLTNFFLVSTYAVVEPMQEGYPGQLVTSQESWGYAYNNERAELFNTLREWKLANASREVTILGGDTHLGSYTDIIYDGEVVFHQLVSSCIASSAYDDIIFPTLDIPLQTKPLVDSWAFKHQILENKYNYGIVLASNQDDKASTDCYLVSL